MRKGSRRTRQTLFQYVFFQIYIYVKTQKKNHRSFTSVHLFLCVHIHSFQPSLGSGDSAVLVLFQITLSTLGYMYRCSIAPCAWVHFPIFAHEITSYWQCVTTKTKINWDGNFRAYSKNSRCAPAVQPFIAFHANVSWSVSFILKNINNLGFEKLLPVYQKWKNDAPSCLFLAFDVFLNGSFEIHADYEELIRREFGKQVIH